MIRVLAIDDEPLALQQLTAYVKRVPFLELAGQCESAVEAIKLLESEPVDAIFCDINMPDLNGMDFVKSLPAPPLVVFTTAYSEYAVEGFRVNAVDYLLKPFGLQDFMRAANRIAERLELKTERYDYPQGMQGNHTSHLSSLSSQLENDDIFVKTDYRIVKLSVSDISYVEGMSEYLKIHLASQPKPVITLLSMKVMEERLPAAIFMRIHRSYIVNLDMITEVNKNRVMLGADVSLPIGDSYKESFNRYVETKFLGR